MIYFTGGNICLRYNEFTKLWKFKYLDKDCERYFQQWNEETTDGFIWQ